MTKYETAFINEIVNTPSTYRCVNPKKTIVVPQETLNTYFHSKFRDIVKSFKFQNELYNLISYSSISTTINKEIKNKFCDLIHNISYKLKVKRSIKEILYYSNDNLLDTYLKHHKEIENKKSMPEVGALYCDQYYITTPQGYERKLRIKEIKKVINEYKKSGRAIEYLEKHNNKWKLPTRKDHLIDLLYNGFKLSKKEITKYLYM